MLGVSIRQQQRQDWNQTAWLYISNKPDIDRDYDLLLLLFLVLLAFFNCSYGYASIHPSVLPSVAHNPV
jgi:hypothetical protein